MSCLRAMKEQRGDEAPYAEAGAAFMDDKGSVFSDIESPSGTINEQPSIKKAHSSNNGKPVISPTSGVHELLECPVCTNSMYPPIHQVSFLSPIQFRFYLFIFHIY